MRMLALAKSERPRCAIGLTLSRKLAARRIAYICQPATRLSLRCQSPRDKPHRTSCPWRCRRRQLQEVQETINLRVAALG
jgi:hypothetical protein